MSSQSSRRIVHTAGLILFYWQDVVRLMDAAMKNRATSSTNMNEHSSRSHLIITVGRTSAKTFRTQIPVYSLSGYDSEELLCISFDIWQNCKRVHCALEIALPNLCGFIAFTRMCICEGCALDVFEASIQSLMDPSCASAFDLLNWLAFSINSIDLFVGHWSSNCDMHP